MTGHSGFMIIIVILVAFIAGYAVVSYVARKFKAWRERATRTDQDHTGTDDR